MGSLGPGVHKVCLSPLSISCGYGFLFQMQFCPPPSCWGFFSALGCGVSPQLLKRLQLGADCGSDPEFLTAKFRLKLKKIGKTTRPFRYDLNQIPYNYTVEVTNRFNGLDLIERVPDELWTEVGDNVQEAVIKTISPRKRN